MATKLHLGMDIPFIRGDTIPLGFLFKDSQGALVDISGRTFWLTIKLTGLESDAEAPVRLSETLVDGTNGLCTFIIPDTTTAELLPASYQYDLQGIDGGLVTTYLYGKIKFAKGDYD